jgi:hypothetical protein
MIDDLPEATINTRFVHRAREEKTIAAMVRLYCRGHGHTGATPLCADCTRLLGYAARRLQRCVFGDAKPTCADCPVHCYRADMREQIRTVMRWAGPRMLLRHPVMAIAHMIAERRPVPPLPERMLGHKRYRGSARAGV